MFFDTLQAQYPDLAEYIAPLQASPLPVVAAIGDYNTGKSALLNALMERDLFTVADRRETRYLQQGIAHGLCWLDTPGLNADPDGADDTASQQAMAQADHLLILHAIGNGELAPTLLALLEEHDATLVITRIDEVSDVDLQQSLSTIEQQWNGPLLLCSSTRWQQGQIPGQEALRAASGIAALRQQLITDSATWLARRQQRFARYKDRLDQILFAREIQMQSRIYQAQLSPLLARETLAERLNQIIDTLNR
ncbi:GTPase [Aeromonas veronii]